MHKRGDIIKVLKEMEATKICEVGVRDGGFFRDLLKVPTIKEAYAIDIWDLSETRSQNDVGRTKEELIESYENFKKNFPDAIVIKKFSDQAVFDLPDDLDFIYIDADHTYEAVSKDLVLYYSRLRSGGILGGHDYMEYTWRGVPFGVKRAVDEFAERYGLNLVVTDEARFKSWFIKKP